MRVDGQLYRAQLECRTSDLANTITGAIWYRTDTTQIKVATGSGYLISAIGDADESTLTRSSNTWSIKSGGITNTHINSSAAIAYSKLNLSNSIVAGDITSSAVTTAKINDNAVTTAKLAGLNYVNGTSSGAYSTSSGTPVTACTATFSTGTTRGIVISVQSDGSSNNSYIEATDGILKIMRVSDNVELARYPINGRVFSLQHVVITGLSGSQQYDVSVYVNSGTIAVNYMRLTVFEIG